MDSRQRTSMYLRWKSSLYNRLQIFITTESSSIVSCLPDQLNPERLDSISDHHLPAAPQALKWQVPRKSHRWPCTLTSDYHSGSNSTRKSYKMRDYVFEVQFWLCIAFFHSPFHTTFLLLLIGHDPLSDFFSSFHFVHLHSFEKLGANHNLSCHYIFMGRGLTIFSHFIVTKMAIFLTVDYNEASMCWNCEEMCGKWKVFLTLFLTNVRIFSSLNVRNPCAEIVLKFSSHFPHISMWGKRPISSVHVRK